MSSILIAESGSTKTDWCLLRKGTKPLLFKTSGINPYLQSREEIIEILSDEMKLDSKKQLPDALHYYGAGAGNTERQRELQTLLRKHFNIKKVTVQSDMMAAAIGLCGDKKGIVCILGTGSNSCYYNGNTIKEQKISLGFIAGDEGSGNYLGKRVLQYYAYNTFDTELRMVFEQYYGNDMPAILHKLYREPFPNRYLATFVKLLVDNRGHFMVENIIEDCLNDFFHHHILKYRQSWNLPLYFIGSVAYEFKDALQNLCNQYELQIGDVQRSPMDGLIKYHKKQL